MYNAYNNYSYPNHMSQWQNRDRMYNYQMYPNPYFYNNSMINPDYMNMYSNPIIKKTLFMIHGI